MQLRLKSHRHQTSPLEIYFIFFRVSPICLENEIGIILCSYGIHLIDNQFFSRKFVSDSLEYHNLVLKTTLDILCNVEEQLIHNEFISWKLISDSLEFYQFVLKTKLVYFVQLRKKSCRCQIFLIKISFRLFREPSICLKKRNWYILLKKKKKKIHCHYVFFSKFIFDSFL